LKNQLYFLKLPALLQQHAQTASRLNGVPINKLYWLFQVAGWATMLLYELVNYLAMGYFTPVGFGFLSLSALVALTLTHVYHLIIRRVDYSSLKLYQQVLYFFIALVSLSVCLFLTSEIEQFIITHRLNKDIISMQSLMYIVNWSRYIVVWLLFYHVAKYFMLKNKAEVAVLETTLELQDTRLNVLRLQLNPHFLFNALNSIRSLIVYDSEQAREATTRLSQLLRHTLNYEQQDFIPVKQEIHIVKDYLMLEKIRFDERLDYTIDIPKSAEELQVPASLILTLVENAIKHGIGNSIKGGMINIAIALQEKTICIQVSNTGQLTHKVNNAGGIGIQNIKKRLELYYANRAIFNIENKDEQTVLATVQIPITV